jgi:hypothetical protein
VGKIYLKNVRKKFETNHCKFRIVQNAHFSEVVEIQVAKGTLRRF